MGPHVHPCEPRQVSLAVAPRVAAVVPGESGVLWVVGFIQIVDPAGRPGRTAMGTPLRPGIVPEGLVVLHILLQLERSVSLIAKQTGYPIVPRAGV